MKSNPLVSVIIPTRNSAQFLDACLASIKNQSYKNIEIIVVDNNSTDKTKEIALSFCHSRGGGNPGDPMVKVFNKGPERSAQVNWGVSKASGTYVYKVDSDFILEKNVIAECVEKASEGYDAVVVHNTPDETVSWIAKLRKFEVDLYKYDLTHSSARFIKKDLFIKMGGFNEKITAGEDYDFQNRLNRLGYKTGFVDAEAIHLGEPRNFWLHMRKYYDYGRDFINYRASNKPESNKQLSFFRGVYIRNWRKFVIHPIYGISFIFYNTCKFIFGGLGYTSSALQTIFCTPHNHLNK